MPALVDSRSCQGVPVVPPANHPRRIVPVVPVIPKTLEKKKTKKDVDERSVGSAVVEGVTTLPRQPSSRRRGSSVVTDSRTKPENRKFESKSPCVAEEDKGEHSNVRFFIPELIFGT